MRRYVSTAKIAALVLVTMGLAAPTFAQAPPPLDPDPGASLIVTAKQRRHPFQIHAVSGQQFSGT
jgi:hypothetical protein